MNTDELRTAFTAGQALEDRISNFQRARISLIGEGNTPVDMEGGPKLVLYAVPLVLFAVLVGRGFVLRRYPVDRSRLINKLE